MISTLTNLGTLRFMIFGGALTAVIFLVFLQRLVRDAPRKVFLIVDNLRVHRARLVTAWVEADKDRIELFYLPPYAPRAIAYVIEMNIARRDLVTTTIVGVVRARFITLARIGPEQVDECVVGCR